MPPFDAIITVSLNPAIDRVIEVPGFALGGHQKGRVVSRQPAGKAINVSRALHTLGISSIATGFVGQDESDLFEKSLTSPTLHSELMAVQGATRENITIVDPQSHQETHIRDVGFTVTTKDVKRLKKKLHVLARDGVLVVFSGSTPPGIDAEQFVELIQVCQLGGAKVAVDTSGPELRAAVNMSLWLAKPNANELADILDHPVTSDDDIIAAARDLASHIDNLLVSRGDAGGYAFCHNAAMIGQVPLDPSRVVSTVGAGDSLLAGFIAAHQRNLPPADAYRLALAVATATVISRDAGQFDPATLDEFLTTASVLPLD